MFSFLGWPSRGWFRSIDLWVMGPALFRCGTLLFLPALLLLAPGLSMQKYILEKYESQAFCCLVSIGLQARFEKLQLIISRPAKGGELLGMKLATCSPLKASWRTSHPGVRLRIRKANLRGTILEWHLKRE